MESSLLLALVVEQSYFANGLLSGSAEQLISVDGDVGFPRTKGTGFFTISAVPFGALSRLKALFVADFHQRPVVAEMLKFGFDPLAERSRVRRNIPDHEIGNDPRRRTHPDVRAAFSGQFPDQENETADALAQGASIGAVVEFPAAIPPARTKLTAIPMYSFTS